MKVVVTGAAGFLGRALLRSELLRGHEVIGVARTSAPGFARVSDYSQSPPGDVLVHLAQSSDRSAVNAGGPAARDDALRDLDALLGKGYGRVVYGSSAALYSDTLTRPARPDDATDARDLYATIKLECEARLSDVEGAVVCRLSNLYGPGMSAANVLSDILRKLTQPGPLELRDLSAVRDFLWIGDAADGVAALALARDDGVFNIGSGIGVSTGDLSRQILAIAGQPRRDVVATNPANRFSSIVLDISKSLERLRWRPPA